MNRGSADQPVAIVTGAAQGIGARTAEVLAEAGHALVLCDLRPCEDTARAVEARGARVADVPGDLTADGAAVAVAAAAREAFGRIDVLVNNAGVAAIAPAEATDPADFRQVLEVNLVAPFALCRAVAGDLLGRGTGSIVNVASVAGLLGVADRVAYNASKHGLIGLTRTLAAEWGGRGVRCNAVCPGWVKTPMDEGAQAAGLYADEDIVARVPMARFATPDDVARAIAFLADPVAAAFVNGHTLSVDGGWFADGSWDALRAAHR
jgi:NAD(P)-dependent dehydrogenase (short-subunit alcohol dehydrogenase family)